MKDRRKEPLYMIGTVAKMYNIHPQTLRLYEKEGLIVPSRTKGKTRMYSEEDLERLEFILFLTRELGVNLAGVDAILRMKQQIEELQNQIQLLLTKIQEEIREKYINDQIQQQNALVQLPKVEIMKIEEYIYTKYNKKKKGDK
ncbi:heat shock protein transcriptional repressor HspR [Sulfurihydrogenibium azorense]|jgi:MerR family transcriptional regulator/heat shock protein HspR|uniref:Transcriptional regulator n=1 Tax=Sulfurihydrogenibium azorense (strain DSM 15241 / OCM 825 / Az-Fu1) TaxID=204536 RepID=C1DW66_SULAA|nr:helix-turn-helix transcriptional regulator [Sulfurihydrogenibium azorense]ACN98543.1 transcriptional regulator [Sulfurihydrogenibium azorense Az-Fu1]MDM7273797.1 helix-turn-helix transcriptional regulator [Sulfurihydrogenibium azorense]